MSMLNAISDIKSWTIDDVKKYAMDISTTRQGLHNRINKVLMFIETKEIDGIKMNWLISGPYEYLPNSKEKHIAGKLKNLDPVLWKGIRWKDFLEPIIVNNSPQQNIDPINKDSSNRIYSTTNENIYN
jgi:hypothetical protein